MPGTRHARGIVLRRTKLGETDLIVTFLADEDLQVRAVAKGARKPGARLSGVVNLGNEVDVLLYAGRNLDMVTDGTLVRSRAGLARDLERSAMAEALLDCAAELTAEGEHNPNLLPLTSTALDAIDAAAIARLPLVGAAYILKATSMQGFRPSFDVCSACGRPVDVAGERLVSFSLADGGVLCADCAGAASGVLVDANLIAWARSLIGMRFADILALPEQPGETELGLDMLEFCRKWLEYYPGVHPRALDFVLSLGTW